jgi:hypothetical protein
MTPFGARGTDPIDTCANSRVARQSAVQRIGAWCAALLLLAAAFCLGVASPLNAAIPASERAALAALVALSGLGLVRRRADGGSARARP